MVADLDVLEQFRSLLHQTAAPAQEVASGSHLGRVGIGLGEQVRTQQTCDLARIELVVLLLATVDRPHVQRMAQHEAKLLLLTQVSEPVPGEDALAANHQVVSVRSDGFQERFRLRRQVLVEEPLTLSIQNAQEHGSCVKINTTVVLM